MFVGFKYYIFRKIDLGDKILYKHILNNVQLFLIISFFIAINVNFKFSSTLFGILFLFTFLQNKFNRKSFVFTGNDLKYILASGIIVFMDIILVLLHPVNDASLNILKKNLQYYIMMILLIYIVDSYEKIRYVCYGFLVSGFICPLYTIYLNLQGVIRAGGLMDGNVNVFSTHLLMLLPIVIFSGWYLRENKKLKYIAILECGLILYSLLQAASRGAFLSLFIGSFIMSLIIFNYRLKYLIYIVLSFLGAIIFLWATDAVLITRLIQNANLYSYENIIRINIYTNSWEMFLNNWLFGIGLGQYSNVYYQYMMDDNPVLHFSHAHNLVLMYMVECGIVGLIALFCFFMYQYYFYGKCLYSPDNKISSISRALLLILTFIILYMMVEYTFDVTGIKRVFWCIIGFAYSVTKVYNIKA